jgi:nitrite reductase/ring-hydroxylating ferredoxin subunit
MLNKRKLNRRTFLTSISALLPSFFLAKAEASPTFSLAKAAATSLGAKVTKSALLKVGQTLAFTGQDTNGRTIEVILTRTKKGVVALDGTCTHKCCLVGVQKTSLICPCHGSVFNPNTGAPLMGPNGSPKSSIQPLGKYTATEKSGYIYIK